MPQCPVCEHTLDQNFGMVTCGECQAVLMIDISGQIQVGSEAVDLDQTDTSVSVITDVHVTDDAPESTSTSDFSPTEFASFEDGDVTGTDLIETPTTGPLSDSSENEYEIPTFEDPPTEGSSLASVEENTFSDEQSEVLSGAPGAVDDSDDYLQNAGSTADDDESFDPLADEFSSAVESEEEDDQFLVEEVEDTPEDQQELDGSVPLEIAESPDSNPVDVTSFANSEASNLDGGEYLYDVRVTRLDSKELKEEFKYILMDEKLKISPSDYLGAIKNGEVTIFDLNPIKAKRIVEQLQFLDVGIHWTQKRVVMQEDQGEEIDSEADV